MMASLLNCFSLIVWTLYFTSFISSLPANRQYVETPSHMNANRWHHAGWSSLGEADSNELIHLTFALKQQNLDTLDELFHEISNPESERYGQHLSYEEVNALTQPHEDAVETVRAWLLQPEFGLSEDALELKSSGDFLVVDGVPVAVAERMFHCNMHRYEHEKTHEIFIRSADGYSLPSHVAEVVDFVGGVARLHKGQMRAMSLGMGAHELNADDIKVTPAVLRQLYNIPADMKGTNESNSQAAIGFLGQYFNPSDVSAYLKINNLPVRAVERIVGKNVISNPGSEATLDLEAIMGISPGVKTEFWSFSGLRDNNANASYWNQEPFLNWMLTIADSDAVPLVHSVSYDDDEYTLSRSYINRLNAEFRKAALRGITLLFASGDDGIGGINVREKGGSNCTHAVPAFPAGSPYVTAVGATMIDSSGTKEIVCSSSMGSFITTGGGFSNLFTIPTYQLSHVQKFMSHNDGSHLPPEGYFNPRGRVFPDVSLIGNNYQYVIHGTQHFISGTSASTPVFAGIIALLNDVRLNRGQAPLGFLNYWLYSLADKYGWDETESVFHDVVSGDNRCSANDNNCCEYGFQATPGFDAVSGLGTPNFTNMLKHI